ncbi:MAG: NADPH:quinone reductase-like Zn-dependent oxidoreductase, partial [Myxococcota bacterium]
MNSRSMRAAVRSEYGTENVLSIQDVDVPSPSKGEVLIEVRASSMNQGDWLMLQGNPWLVRLFTGLFRPRKRGVGLDVAGVVVAVGSGVSRLALGDEVYGEVSGAMAQYAIGAEKRLAHKPRNLSFEEAAAVPVAGVTALQALRDKVSMTSGMRVLVIGASGGVGSFAVQVAKAFGAQVTAVGSTRNVELMRSIGAADVIDYSVDDFTKTEQRFDAILDLVGSQSIGACRRILTSSGVYISSSGRLGAVFSAMLWSLVPGSRVKMLAAMCNTDDLEEMAGLIEAGKVKPLIDRRFTLADVGAAFGYQGEGHARGKSIVVV